MELIKPSIEYKESFIKGAKEFQALGDEKRFRRMNINIPEVEKDFDKYLEKLANEEKGIGLKEGYVPATTLWLVNNEKFIGRVSIRHKLNDALMEYGGHIGYAIRPSERNKGYGTKILELALPLAKKLGISKALITCDDDNPGSIKIREKNGGVLENTSVSPEGKLKRRYWIENK